MPTFNQNPTDLRGIPNAGLGIPGIGFEWGCCTVSGRSDLASVSPDLGTESCIFPIIPDIPEFPDNKETGTVLEAFTFGVGTS